MILAHEAGLPPVDASDAGTTEVDTTEAGTTEGGTSDARTGGDGFDVDDESGAGHGPEPRPGASLVTVRRTVPVDWTDYNGDMNEGRYGQVFSDAADAVLVRVGCDPDYVAGGLSWFTAETTIRYLAETLAAERVIVRTRVDLADGRKLRLVHEMRREADEVALASCEQFLLHVSLDTRRSCDPPGAVATRLAALARAHVAHAVDAADTNTGPNADRETCA